MVDNNRNRVWDVLEVLFPFRKGKDNDKEFFVVDVIVTFHQGECLGEVGIGVKISVSVLCIRMAPVARREASDMIWKG